ncbi:hypothetical protein CR513_25980, partial [Mucuna pruriens]
MVENTLPIASESAFSQKNKGVVSDPGNKNESSVHGDIRPGAGDVTILANVSANNGLPVVVEAEAAAEAEGGVEIPGEFAVAKGAGQVELPLVAVVNGPPNPSAFEVLENASEEPVLSLLFLVDAAGPVAHVQAVVAELTRQELASLLAAQAPRARGQVGAPRAGQLPLLARANGSHARVSAKAIGFRKLRRVRFGGGVEGVVVEVEEEGGWKGKGSGGGQGRGRVRGRSRRCRRGARRVGGRGSRR